MSKKLKGKTRKTRKKGEFTRLYEKNILSFPISQRIIVDSSAKEKYDFVQTKFDKGVHSGKTLWSDDNVDIGYAFFLVDKINKDPKEEGGLVYNIKLMIEVDKMRLPFEFKKEDLLPKIEVYMTSEFNVIVRFKEEDILKTP